MTDAIRYHDAPGKGPAAFFGKRFSLLIAVVTSLIASHALDFRSRSHVEIFAASILISKI